MDIVATISGSYPSDIFPSARGPMSTTTTILTTWGTMDRSLFSGTASVAQTCHIEITRRGKKSKKKLITS